MRKAESNLEELRPLVDEEHCFHSYTHHLPLVLQCH